MSGTDPLADRRQRAREAGHDLAGPSIVGDNVAAIEAAIETATRVQVTEEILARARQESPDGFIAVRAVIAAFRAAGFEVEE